MSLQSWSSSPHSTIADTASVYEAVQHLSCFYPGFHNWFWATVVPGIVDGSRHINAVRKDDGQVVATAISKKTAEERKLCTLWVEEKERGFGQGVRLTQMACDWLGTAKPRATVGEENYENLLPLAKRFGWQMTDCRVSLYRDGRREYEFNGDRTEA